MNSTLNELVDKWETVVTFYMNYGKARSDEEKEREAGQECTTRYKLLRKQFVETKHSVSKALYSVICSTSIPEGIHPLLQPLFCGKCLPSLPTPLTSIPNPEAQPEVPAFYDIPPVPVSSRLVPVIMPPPTKKEKTKK